MSDFALFDSFVLALSPRGWSVFKLAIFMTITTIPTFSASSSNGLQEIVRKYPNYFQGKSVPKLEEEEVEMDEEK
jgi:hypothetical protein